MPISLSSINISTFDDVVTTAITASTTVCTTIYVMILPIMSAKPDGKVVWILPLVLRKGYHHARPCFADSRVLSVSVEGTKLSVPAVKGC